MPSGASVVRYEGKRGVTWRVKYFVSGRQIQVTLGKAQDGWTRERAQAELERLAGPPKTLIERFQSRIERDGDCLRWTGAKTTEGYPRFLKRRAHRWIWEQTYGPLPRHLELHHTCGNRDCVNVSHLEPLTRDDHLDRHHRP